MILISKRERWSMKLIFVFQSMRKGSGICIMARNLVEIPLQIACEAKVANITSSHKDMSPLEKHGHVT